MDSAAEPAIQSLDCLQQPGRVVSASDLRSGGPGQVRVPLWQLAGLVLGRPEFKSSATLVKLIANLLPPASWGF